MLLEEKQKISEVAEFSILPYTKIENSEFSEYVLLLQILILVVTFSKFVFSIEKVQPFFATFNIMYFKY